MPVAKPDDPRGSSLVYARDGAWIRWDARDGEAALAPGELSRRADAGTPDGHPPPAPGTLLALAAQFALLDDGEELAAYSPADRALVSVSPRALDTLLAFHEPGRVDEASGTSPIVAWAVAKGFLVPYEAPSVVVSAPRVEPAAERRSRKPSLPAPNDPRLPVYLVTGPDPNYFPLALGLIRALAEALDNGRLLQTLRFVPFITGGPKDVAAAFMENGPGVWLMSDYMWSLESNLAASALVKRLSSRNITVHGGPSAPKYPDASEAFLFQHRDVDFLVRGEGERSAVDLLEALATAHATKTDAFASGMLDEIPGLVFLAPRDGGFRAVRTPDRPRIEDLDAIPSPYLAGIFDEIADGMVAAPVETNRGCPYGCTFCDWGSATLQKLRKFDLARVEAEIRWLAAHRVPILWVADANFGILDRDLQVAELVAALHRETGYPREFVVNYAKNATLRVAEIVRTLTRAGLTTQGIISIQTRDEPTLISVKRSNIKTKRYEELSSVFREEGLPLTVELMLGLPGSTLESLKADLQHYFDEGTPVRVYDTVVLPNSPMADPAYMREHALEIDERGYVVASRSFSRADLDRMDAVARLYRVAVDCSVLRHVLTFLQWDHGVRALDFLDVAVRTIREAPRQYPHTTFLLDNFRTHGRMRGGWGPLFHEVARLATDHFGVPRSSALSAVLQANELVLPEEGRSLPRTYELEHDVIGWARDRGKRRLSSYPPGELTVSDPDKIVTRLRLDARPAEFIQHFWELDSALARVRAKVHFVKARGAA